MIADIRALTIGRFRVVGPCHYQTTRAENVNKHCALCLLRLFNQEPSIPAWVAKDTVESRALQVNCVSPGQCCHGTHHLVSFFLPSESSDLPCGSTVSKLTEDFHRHHRKGRAENPLARSAVKPAGLFPWMDLQLQGGK